MIRAQEALLAGGTDALAAAVLHIGIALIAVVKLDPDEKARVLAEVALEERRAERAMMGKPSRKAPHNV